MFDINHLKVDQDKAKNGTWVDYYKGSKLCIARANNPDAEQYRIEKAIEHADVFQAGGDKAEQLAYDVETYTIAHHILKDWEGITVGGEPLDYTPDEGMKFLSDPNFQDFRDDVLRFARNREHYRVESEELAAEAVKPAAAS